MNLKRFALGTIYALRLCFLVLESTVPTVVEVRRGEGDGSLDTVPSPGAKPFVGCDAELLVIEDRRSEGEGSRDTVPAPGAKPFAVWNAALAVVKDRRSEGEGSLDTVPAPGAKPSMTEEKRSKFRSNGGEQTTSTEYVDGNRGLPFSTKDKWGSECSTAKLQELKLYDPGSLI